MSITAKVQHGSVPLPPGITIPDGTIVQIIVPEVMPRGVKPVRLPSFSGNGLQPGADLDDARALRRLLEETGRLSQLP